MAKGQVTSLNQPRTRRKPALMSQEARMSKLTSMALDLIEERLANGTATSQETTYFLRYHCREADLKEQLLEKQVQLMEAKAENLKAQQKSEELYAKAIEAMRSYQGYSGDGEPYED